MTEHSTLISAALGKTQAPLMGKERLSNQRQGFNLTSTAPTTPHILLSAGLLPRVSLMWDAALTPPSSSSPPPHSATALPPRPLPPMQSRPAAERANRLSLLPLVQDLDKAAAGQPAAPPPSGPKSEMEWDEEAPPRAQEKVRDLFRRVLSRRERRTAAVAAAKAKAKSMAMGMGMAMANTKPTQQADHNSTSTIYHTQSVQPEEKIKGGSIQNARRGIAERRKLEVSFSLHMRDITY